jgi:hypothetical protein
MRKRLWALKYAQTLHDLAQKLYLYINTFKNQQILSLIQYSK